MTKMEFVPLGCLSSFAALDANLCSEPSWLVPAANASALISLASHRF